MKDDILKAAIGILNNAIDDIVVENYVENKSPELRDEALSLVTSFKATLDCLQAELDRIENKPLELSELKEMIGEPVWHNGECDVIQEVFEDEKHIGDWYIDTHQGTIAISQFNKFYKHKPKGD